MRRLALLTLLVACGAPEAPSEEPAPAAPAAPSLEALATAEVVDLTHPFDEHTLYWPTSPSTFELTELHAGPTPAGCRRRRAERAARREAVSARCSGGRGRGCRGLHG